MWGTTAWRNFAANHGNHHVGFDKCSLQPQAKKPSPKGTLLLKEGTETMGPKTTTRFTCNEQMMPNVQRDFGDRGCTSDHVHDTSGSTLAAAEHYSPYMNHLHIGALINGIATSCIRCLASETYGGCGMQAMNKLAKQPLITVINAAVAGIRSIVANALVNARTRGALEQSADNRLDREMGVLMNYEHRTRDQLQEQLNCRGGLWFSINITGSRSCSCPHRAHLLRDGSTHMGRLRTQPGVDLLGKNRDLT